MYETNNVMLCKLLTEQTAYKSPQKCAILSYTTHQQYEQQHAGSQIVNSRAEVFVIRKNSMNMQTRVRFLDKNR